MSLITRCPACETLFKVVPDQLRISEGWVRCGQCDDIFDASLHLLPDSSTEWEPAAAREALLAQSEANDTPVSPCPSDDRELNSAPMGDLAALAEDQDQGSAPELVAPTAAENVAELDSPESIPDEISPVDEAISLSMELLDAQTLVLQSVPATAITAVRPVDVAQPDLDEPEVEPLAEFSAVSFMRDQSRRSVWRKPLVRVTLGLFSLVLLLGLFVQIIFHERDRIVALEPGLKPWLLAFCRPLSCSLSPLQRIESIAIDSSSFIKMNSDFYRLNLTVKNSAAIALAVPAIELTLTDSLDQPVVRRVFLPTELGGNSDTLAAGAEWSASRVLAVKTAGPADRVAGYRLLAFYP
jgi:predicted Zn finger-like uncharacterized protein